MTRVEIATGVHPRRGAAGPPSLRADPAVVDTVRSRWYHPLRCCNPAALSPVGRVDLHPGSRRWHASSPSGRVRSSPSPSPSAPASRGRCTPRTPRSGCATPRSRPDGRTIAFAFKGDIYTVPAVGGRRAPAHAGRVARVRAGVEPRRPLHRLRLRPLRQLRRVRDAGHGRRGHAPHLPLGRGDPELLHGGRPVGPLLRLPPGAGDQRAVPHRPHDAALVRAGRRRARRPGAPGPGRQRHARRLGRQGDLRGREGIRGRLAEAPHLRGDARRVGLRHGLEGVQAALAVRRGEPQPGVRRGRRPLLLPERAERVVQRLPQLPLRPRHQRRRSRTSTGTRSAS